MSLYFMKGGELGYTIVKPNAITSSRIVKTNIPEVKLEHFSKKDQQKIKRFGKKAPKKKVKNKRPKATPIGKPYEEPPKAPKETSKPKAKPKAPPARSATSRSPSPIRPQYVPKPKAEVKVEPSNVSSFYEVPLSTFGEEHIPFTNLKTGKKVDVAVNISPQKKRPMPKKRITKETAPELYEEGKITSVQFEEATDLHKPKAPPARKKSERITQDQQKLPSNIQAQIIAFREGSLKQKRKELEQLLKTKGMQHWYEAGNEGGHTFTKTDLARAKSDDDLDELFKQEQAAQYLFKMAPTIAQIEGIKPSEVDIGIEGLHPKPKERPPLPLRKAKAPEPVVEPKRRGRPPKVVPVKLEAQKEPDSPPPKRDLKKLQQELKDKKAEKQEYALETEYKVRKAPKKAKAKKAEPLAPLLPVSTLENAIIPSPGRFGTSPREEREPALARLPEQEPRPASPKKRGQPFPEKEKKELLPIPALPYFERPPSPKDLKEANEATKAIAESLGGLKWKPVAKPSRIKGKPLSAGAAEAMALIASLQNISNPSRHVSADDVRQSIEELVVERTQSASKFRPKQRKSFIESALVSEEARLMSTIPTEVVDTLNDKARQSFDFLEATYKPPIASPSSTASSSASTTPAPARKGGRPPPPVRKTAPKAEELALSPPRRSRPPAPARRNITPIKREPEPELVEPEPEPELKPVRERRTPLRRAPSPSPSVKQRIRELSSDRAGVPSTKRSPVVSPEETPVPTPKRGRPPKPAPSPLKRRPEVSVDELPKEVNPLILADESPARQRRTPLKRAPSPSLVRRNKSTDEVVSLGREVPVELPEQLNTEEVFEKWRDAEAELPRGRLTSDESLESKYKRRNASPSTKRGPSPAKKAEYVAPKPPTAEQVKAKQPLVQPRSMSRMSRDSRASISSLPSITETENLEEALTDEPLQFDFLDQIQNDSREYGTKSYPQKFLDDFMGLSREGKVPLSRKQPEIARLIKQSGKKLNTIELKKLALNPFKVARGVEVLDELHNAFLKWRTLPGNSSSFLKGAAEDTMSQSTTSSRMSKAEIEEHDRNRIASLDKLAHEVEELPTSPGGFFSRRIMENLESWFPMSVLRPWMKENKTSLEEINNLSVIKDKDRIDELEESYNRLSAPLEAKWRNEEDEREQHALKLEEEKLKLERESGVVLPPQDDDELEQALKEFTIPEKKQKRLEEEAPPSEEEEEEEEEEEYSEEEKQKYAQRYELYKEIMAKGKFPIQSFNNYIRDMKLDEEDVRPEHEKAGYGSDSDYEYEDIDTPAEAYDQYLASKPTNPLSFDDFATQLAKQDLAEQKLSGKGLKEGSFSHQLQTHNKKHSSKMSLEHFAHMVITSPSHFDKRTLKQAQFYLDIIMHQKSKGKGIVKEDDEEIKSHHNNIMPMIHSVRHSVQHPAMASPHSDFVLTPNAHANIAAFHGGALKDDMMHMYHSVVPKSMRGSVENLGRETARHVLRHPEVKQKRREMREMYDEAVPKDMRRAIRDVAYTGAHHAMEGGSMKTRMQKAFVKVVPNKNVRESLVDLGKTATREVVNSKPVTKVRRQVRDNYNESVPQSLKDPLKELGKATLEYGKKKAGYGKGLKGSKEMKDKMARLRAMRKSKGGAIPAPPSRSPITDPSLL